MKTLYIIGVCIFSLLFTSCTNLTPNQARVANAALSISQVVANVALQSVISRAVSDQDLVKKGNYVDSAAAALRTLQGRTGGLVTPELIGQTVLQFTDPSKTHWQVLAEKVAIGVTSAPLPTDVALEQAAAGLNQAAAEARAQAKLDEPVVITSLP